MRADPFLRRAHRVVAALFLLCIPPAAWFSLTATGDEVSPVVYFPLVPLFGLMLTGSYLLVRPWIQRFRTRGTSPEAVEPGTKP
jgi:hypothetical protein